MYVPLPASVLRGPTGSPIANGLLFITEATNNNRVTAFLDALGTKPYRAWPYRLSADGRASLWLPLGTQVLIQVFGDTGRLLLHSAVYEPVLQDPEATTSSGAAKTLVYSGGALTQVDEFTDATKSVLKQRKTLTYTGGVLSSVVTMNGNLEVTNTRTLSYVAGALVGVTDT